MSASIYIFLFCIGIVLILLFDLLYVGKNSHILSTKEAFTWTIIWICLSFLFSLYLLFFGHNIHDINNLDNLKDIIARYGPDTIINNDYISSLANYRYDLAISFITGYLIELTLSIDNLFVIMLIFSSFSLSEKYYKKVLFWGILGAIVFRCIFIFAGVAIVEKFQWLLVVFGIFLLYSGFKILLFKEKDKKFNIKNSLILKIISKKINIFPRYVKDHFVLKSDNKCYITPLLVILIFVEISDIIFAFDSIPAIFSVSSDPYIIFFSNIFAIIGLRSMFFLLFKVVDMFYYLKYGISVLLVFIGFKLIFHQYLTEIGFKTIYSLFIISSILLLSVLLSYIKNKFSKK